MFAALALKKYESGYERMMHVKVRDDKRLIIIGAARSNLALRKRWARTGNCKDTGHPLPSMPRSNVHDLLDIVFLP